MFTYAGYVTVNLSNHNCNGKEEVKKKFFSLGIPTHNKPHFMRCGRICRRLVCSESVDQEPSLQGGELDENSILGRTPGPNFTRIGPLQLVIYVVKNRHAGEQKSH